MTHQEYNAIQRDFMHHHDKAQKMPMTTRERDAYLALLLPKEPDPQITLFLEVESP